MFGAELEVVPDRIAKFLTENSSLVMLGMGAGKYADARYLFTENICDYGKNHKPRRGKVYRNFASRHKRLQNERIAAFRKGDAGPQRVPSEQGRCHDYHEAFEQAARTGTPPPVTAEQVSSVLEVLDAARHGADEGQSVSLNSSFQRERTQC